VRLPNEVFWGAAITAAEYALNVKMNDDLGASPYTVIHRGRLPTLNSLKYPGPVSGTVIVNKVKGRKSIPEELMGIVKQYDSEVVPTEKMVDIAGSDSDEDEATEETKVTKPQKEVEKGPKIRKSARLREKAAMAAVNAIGCHLSATEVEFRNKLVARSIGGIDVDEDFEVEGPYVMRERKFGENFPGDAVRVDAIKESTEPTLKQIKGSPDESLHATAGYVEFCSHTDKLNSYVVHDLTGKPEGI